MSQADSTVENGQNPADAKPEKQEKSRLARLKYRLRHDRLFVFKTFALVLVIDIVAFWVLGSINPIQLVNPVKFLWAPLLDERPVLKMYYPVAFSLKDTLAEVEKEENSETAKETAEPEQNITDAEIEQRIISVNQKVEQFTESDFESWQENATLPPRDLKTENARLILNELILGPSQGVDFKARRFIKEKTLVKDLWVHGNKIIIHFDAGLWQNYSDTDKAVAKKCIEKTFSANMKIETVEYYISQNG